MQFTDWFCRHKVCVLYAERLVTGTALFVNLHHEQFVIRQGKLGSTNIPAPWLSRPPLSGGCMSLQVL